jgi:RNA polymerase sigma factor (sigma-70 family)
MRSAQEYYPDCPEAFLVSLARSGDRDAFAEIMRRRQSSVRNLMRRFCGEPALADDLAQQVFLKVWLNIRKLKKPSAFNAWLKRLAVNVWLHHLRRKDALRGAGEIDARQAARPDAPGMGLDLDRALATLSEPLRLCVVLSYHEGMSHREIAELTGLPLGTVKSHIKRGASQLQQALTAYRQETVTEQAT